MNRFKVGIFCVVSLAIVGCNGKQEVATVPDGRPEASKNQDIVSPDPKTDIQANKNTPPDKQVAPPAKNKDRFYQLADLHTVEIIYEGKKIKVWVMDNDDKRSEGMMHLTTSEVKDSEGMLFVFPDEKPLSFWMKNTKLALDIAYISSKGRVVSTRALKPMNEDPVPSGGNAMFALEMKLGAFKRLGIKAGGKFVIPESVKL